MKYTTINKKKFSVNMLTKNIMNEYNLHSIKTGANFYPIALNLAQKLSDKSNIDIIKIVGIIAATSPQKTWEQNIILTENIVLNSQFSGTFKILINKCIAILESDGKIETIQKILNGQKIVSFFNNILNIGLNEITIDRHAINIAINDLYQGSISPQNYLFLKIAYLNAAKKLDICPVTLQAITWDTWRKKYKNKKRKK